MQNNFIIDFFFFKNNLQTMRGNHSLHGGFFAGLMLISQAVFFAVSDELSQLVPGFEGAWAGH